MAREFCERGFSFLFVYTREAHPGEHFPAHRSFEQKMSHAQSFKTILEVRRPILVDDILGSSHKAYGSLPNMTYLIGRGGRILFRSDWTDPPTIETVLQYVVSARSRRREGLRLVPFYAELVGYRFSDQEKFLANLARAGERAVTEYERTMKKRTKQKGSPGRIELD